MHISKLISFLIILSVTVIAGCGGGDHSITGSVMNLSVSYTHEGNVSQYSEYAFDEFGRHTEVKNYSDEGSDGEWFTNDDILSGYSKTTFSTDDLSSYTVEYTGQGPDGKWFTNDDASSLNIGNGYQYQQYDSNMKVIRSIRHSDTGADGEWFTPDDTQSMYSGFTTYKYDTAGNRTYSIYYWGVGPDNKAFTGDDEVGYYNVNVYNEKNALIKSTAFFDAGMDMKWFTSDDLTDYVSYTKETDVNGNPVVMVSAASEESENYYGYERVEYTAEGYLLSGSVYINNGIDGEWFNDDDNIWASREYVLY